MESILPPSEWNTNKIVYTSPTNLPNGGRSIYLNIPKGKKTQPIIIQTPEMYLPYGMSCFTSGQYPNYSLTMSFRDLNAAFRVAGDSVIFEPENPNLEELNLFYHFLKQLDEKICLDARKNSMIWFKKNKIEPSDLAKYYTPQIRQTEPYPEVFKVKIVYRDGKFDCPIYENEHTRSKKSLQKVLAKGERVQALIQCTGLWFIEHKFGCSWKVKQIKIKTRPPIDNKPFTSLGMFQTYQFVEDSDDCTTE